MKKEVDNDKTLVAFNFFDGTSGTTFFLFSFLAAVWPVLANDFCVLQKLQK